MMATATIRASKGARQATRVIGGINEAAWNPLTDPALYSNYFAENVDEGKRLNRAALADELNLVAGDDPLIAFVSPLTERRGADLLADAATALLQWPARFVIVGVGDTGLTHRLQMFEAQAPERVVFCNHDDPDLTRCVLAAADLLLMPSRFEPDGVLQMNAQCYGAIPVVRSTGGLLDTVVDATAENLRSGRANGLLFSQAGPAGLCRAVLRGLDLLRDTDDRQRLRGQMMSRPLHREPLLRSVDFGEHTTHKARLRRSSSLAIS